MTTVNNNLYQQIGQVGRDPDLYAKKFAEENGISVDEAKSQLKAQYGDPVQNGDSIFSGSFDQTESTRGPSGLSDIFENNDNININDVLKELLNIFKSLFSKNSEDKQNGIDGDANPDTYAQRYAFEHNMTLDEAKAELKELKGEPVKPDNRTDNTAETTNTSRSKENPFMDPDTYAQEYANEHNISLDEAKAELKETKGEPVKPDKNTNNETSTENVSGSRQNPFMDPNAYAQQYANEHNMTLDEAKAELKQLNGDPKKQ